MQTMTSATLKEFLKGHSTGIVANQVDKVADIAIEAGYAAVWGAYNWTIRRGTTNLATVASQAYTSLPPDFESIISVVYSAGTSDRRINFKSESEFDTDFPDPTIRSGIPECGKLVYQGPAAADKYRIYWYPVPSAVYTLPMAYSRQSDTAFLPNLPPWLVNAVVHKALVFMQPTPDKRFAADEAAERALMRAIASDNPLNTNDPQFGSDPGWDGFHIPQNSGDYSWLA